MTSPFPHVHRPDQAPATGARRLRAASEPAQPRTDEHRCHECGRGPANPLERIIMTAQWLIAGPDGPQLRRYCPSCRPDGPVTDLTCTRCGDGPLLAGDLAADLAGELPEVVRAWLSHGGWQLTGPVCPDCRPRTCGSGDNDNNMRRLPLDRHEIAPCRGVRPNRACD